MQREMPRRRTCGAAALLAALLGALLVACASAPALPAAARLVLFGEEHDQPDHQRQVAEVVKQLAEAGELGAVVIEMAERGRGSAGLPRDADAARVRAALGWSGWDWSAYEGVVMAAVRAGVPVLGGNLPRQQLRDAMADARLDGLVDAPARDKLAAAVREGHCGLLPASQEPGMLRVQIARDDAMAQTLREALGSASGGQRVLLLAGAQHVARDRGVPLHLARAGAAQGMYVVIFGDAARSLAADDHRRAATVPRPDPCEALRRQREKARGAS